MTAARAADRALDAGVAAFAAWTVVYHVCLVARVSAGWALAAWAVLLISGAAAWRWWARRDVARPARGSLLARDAGRDRSPGGGVAGLLLLVVGAALAVAAGVALARSAPYRLVWALWLAAAACGLARTAVRAGGSDLGPAERSGRLELALVVAWIVALAVLSLLLDDPDGDDTFYVHQSAWIGVHGTFPLRDVVYADEHYPALYYPPIFSYEALTGALSWLGGIRAADLVYLVAPPVGSALAVLALWRLLRTWRVPLTALALSAAIVFLLFDAGLHTAFGSFFVSRMWQGKVLMLTIVLPVLLARLHDQAARGSPRGLVALLLAGVAAVGLSTTAIFVVPVVALGCLLPVAARAPGRAAAALVAACAYPVAAGIVTKLSGGRTPDIYTSADVVSSNLVHLTFGTGGIALLALAAVLLAPALLPRPAVGAMAAALALLVGILLAPSVPEAIFDFSGLGRVLWRLTWALPVAAAVGALAVCAGRGPAVLRALPPVALCAALALFGTPVWAGSTGATIESHPVLKRPPRETANAELVLAHARPGDLILAPRSLSQTLLVLSGSVTTVSPRGFFTRALADQPGMHAAARTHLQHVARFGLPVVPATRRELARLRRDLRRVGVDAVCVPRFRVAVRRAVGAAGYAPWVSTHTMTCQRRVT